MTTLDHPAIAAQLAGATVRWAPLVAIDLTSGMQRLWPGFGDRVLGGQTYRGIGNLGQIEVLEQGPGQAAVERIYRLFGSAAMLSNFAADADSAAGREVVEYMQFFETRETDEDGNWVEWQPVGDPIENYWGVMGELRVERPEAAISEQITRVVEVSTTNAFTNRRRPPNAFYTDRDQKARSSGDTIFIAMASVNRRFRWPNFS